MNRRPLARVQVGRAVRGQRLPVRVTAMADSDDINQTFAVRDSIHDTPFAYANTPEISCAFKFHDTRRTRIRHQHLDLLDDAAGNLGIKTL